MATRSCRRRLHSGSITQDYKNKGLSWNQAEHTLQVTTGVGGTPYLDYTLDGWYTTKDFRASDDGDGNLVITIACFAAGTMIATDRGEMPVEQLSTGDRVVTARRAGAPFRQINWIGHRQVSLRAHPDPAAVRPIRIRAGAFGAGLPRRDLRLSPDHAVFQGGVLIPVRYLINGATIAPDDDCDAVDYFHLELSSHDVLLAEGLPAETYLDTGNRAAFANGGAIADLHPDFAWREWDARACAPLVLDGPRLLRVRRRLLANAAKLGHRRTRDAGLHVLGDGRPLPIRATGRVRAVRLPAAAATVRLVSRRWVPAQMRASDADTRVLGVAVSRLWLDGREVSLDSPGLAAGWHGPEARWRWTDGDAALAVQGAREIAFEVAMAGTYWHEQRRHAGRVA